MPLAGRNHVQVRPTRHERHTLSQLKGFVPLKEKIPFPGTGKTNHVFASRTRARNKTHIDLCCSRSGQRAQTTELGQECP